MCPSVFVVNTWEEFSVDVGAAGAVAGYGGHEGGPCVCVSSKISTTSSGSDVRDGARGTVI